ncbi:MAG: hypothetical protein AB2A00_30100 [Myxococcota bacterium]
MPGRMHALRLPLALSLVLFSFAAGCGGCGQTPGTCESSDQCAAGESCVNGACTTEGSSSGLTASSSSSGGLVYCDLDSECTAEEYCNQTIHACVSKHDCDTEADCDPGQECRDFDDPPDGFRECGYPGCNDDEDCEKELGDCGEGQRARCRARACVCEGACGGDCPTGNLCCGLEPSSQCGDQPCCIADPGPCPDQVCSPGFEPNSATGAWSVDLCNYLNTQCGCQELPALPLGDVGNPSSIGMDGTGKLWVLAYNSTYGDLMLGEVQTDRSVDWTFLDGVPVGGAVTGGPSGPRGGVAEPGPDVGKYLDMAVASDGTVHAVYQDSTNGILKYARVEQGNVTRFTLDNERETGVYPTIALDPSGAPRVAWLARRVDVGGTPYGRLKLSAARDATPGGVTDFVVHVLKEVDLTTVPCEGGCAEGYKCASAEAPAIPTCEEELDDSACSADCGTGAFCSAGGCVDEHAGSNLRGIPEGPGVWPSLAIRADGKPILVVYDSFDADLVLHTTQGGDPVDSTEARFTSQILDGNGSDAGLWPQVAVDVSGQAHVVYVHNVTRALLHQTLDGTLSTISTATVDDAARVVNNASDLHRLAEPALSIRSDGVVQVAYQDGTTGELLFCSQNGSAYDRSTLAGGGTGTSFDGLYGFSTDVAARGSGAPVVSTFKKRPDAVDPQPRGELVFFNWP